MDLHALPLPFSRSFALFLSTHLRTHMISQLASQPVSQSASEKRTKKFLPPHFSAATREEQFQKEKKRVSKTSPSSTLFPFLSFFSLSFSLFFFSLIVEIDSYPYSVLFYFGFHSANLIARRMKQKDKTRREETRWSGSRSRSWGWIRSE